MVCITGQMGMSTPLSLCLVQCDIMDTFHFNFLKQRGPEKKMTLSQGHEHYSHTLCQLAAIYAVAAPLGNMNQDLLQQRLLTTDAPTPYILHHHLRMTAPVGKRKGGKMCGTFDFLSQFEGSLVGCYAFGLFFFLFTIFILCPWLEFLVCWPG